MENQIASQKKSNGTIIFMVILILLVLGLSGYIVYDKMLAKESTETKEPEKTENKVVDIDTSIQEETTISYVGAYSGIAEAPAEIGRPTETDELLIKDEENATFCYNVGTCTSCYRGTYLVKDKVLYLHSIYKRVVDGASGTDERVIESGSDNSYMTFTIEESKITYNGEAFGSMVSNLSKVDSNSLKYANKDF